MEEPSQEVVEKLKAEFGTRALHLVELEGNPDAHVEHEKLIFVMTGPSAPEYEKYTEDVAKANAIKDENEKSKAVRSAVQRNALAQIRWPDRERVVGLFAEYPAMSIWLANLLHNTAGASYEVRAKKL